MAEYDLLVIGGGINGVGVAVDAAGRGLSVLLCEKDDLASHTSSASSKLIHGGLRYLEQFEFKLVHEALREREILFHKAPYLVHPLSFVLPYDNHLRPAWMIRLGLFLYDRLAKRAALKDSKKLRLREVSEGKPLKPEFTVGFSYMDCKTDDSRLVVANAKAAKLLGATILTRTVCQSAVRENHRWKVEIFDQRKQEKNIIFSKAIVNAAGPWVSEVLQNVTHTSTHSQIHLDKGSHFVVPKLYEGDHAYILQNLDKRVIFAIPYQEEFTLVGTTDVDYNGDPNQLEISAAETQYLCDSLNYYFERQIRPADIRWSYAGARALYYPHASKAQKITREYHLDLEDERGKAPILSIFGGKLTTYRSLAEHVMQQLKPYFAKMGPAWTANALLPGAHFEEKTFEDFVIAVKKQYPALPEKLLTRYAGSYGCLLQMLLKNVRSIEDLGRHFGAGLYEKEIRYLVENEWAITVDDIIWRRTKLGLFLSDSEIQGIKEYLCGII